MEYIQSLSGSHFDPKIVNKFITNIAAFSNGTVVKLSNGCKGIVIKQNKDFNTRPVIRIFEDEQGRMCDKILDLVSELSTIIIDTE